MKSGLIFAFFVIFAIMLVSSERKDKEQVKVELSADQFGIVPEVGFFKKITNFSERIFFLLTIEKCFDDSYYQKFKLAAASNKFYLVKAIDLIPLKQKPFRQIVHYTPEKQDNPNLS
ncbi:MAG: hypothetical protein K8S18_13435 [Desulfobacula sp.]|nr:hypothetical protein [Desulfobacula sp.]